MEKNDFLTDGVTIVLLTAAAYGGAYLYEFGYTSAYGVPQELIELNVSTLVATGGSLLLISLLVGQCLHLMWMADQDGFFERDNGYGCFVRKWGVSIVLLVSLAALYPPSWMSTPLMVMWAIIMSGDLVLPAIRAERDIPYRTRLANWITQSTEPDKRYTLFASGAAKKFLDVAMLIALFTMACVFLGGVAGRTRSSFGFIDSRTENVILRRYGDRFLLVRYDPKKAEFVKQFSIANVDDVKEPIVWRKMPHMIVRVRKDEPSLPVSKP